MSWFNRLFCRNDHRLEIRLIKMELRIMAAIDDLNAAIVTLGETVTAAVAAIEEEIAKIAALPPDDSAAIAAATANITAITTTLKDEVAKATTPAA